MSISRIELPITETAPPKSQTALADIDRGLGKAAGAPVILVTDGNRRAGGPSTTGHASTTSSHGPDPADAGVACLTFTAQMQS